MSEEKYIAVTGIVGLGKSTIAAMVQELISKLRTESAEHSDIAHSIDLTFDDPRPLETYHSVRFNTNCSLTRDKSDGILRTATQDPYKLCLIFDHDPDWLPNDDSTSDRGNPLHGMEKGCPDDHLEFDTTFDSRRIKYIKAEWEKVNYKDIATSVIRAELIRSRTDIRFTHIDYPANRCRRNNTNTLVTANRTAQSAFIGSLVNSNEEPKPVVLRPWILIRKERTNVNHTTREEVSKLTSKHSSIEASPKLVFRRGVRIKSNASSTQLIEPHPSYNVIDCDSGRKIFNVEDELDELLNSSARYSTYKIDSDVLEALRIALENSFQTLQESMSAHKDGALLARPGTLTEVAERLASARKWSVVYDECPELPASAISVNGNTTIYIHKTLGEIKTARLLLHEIGHLLLGHNAVSEIGLDFGNADLNTFKNFGRQELEADVFAEMAIRMFRFYLEQATGETKVHPDLNCGILDETQTASSSEDQPSRRAFSYSAAVFPEQGASSGFSAAQLSMT